MSLQRILALASGDGSDAKTLEFAAFLAGQHGGVVEVLPVYPDAAADMIVLGMALGAPLPQESVRDLVSAERELQHAIETAAKAAAGTADVAFGAGPGSPRMSVLTRGLSPGQALSREAALADLLVVADDASRAAAVRELRNQALLADRMPVLIGRGDPAGLAGPAAIAWDGSPQAGRAVRAALPLLAMAEAIHVLQCVTGLDRKAGDPEIETLNGYLSLHGVGTAVPTFVAGDDEGEALLAAAAGMQAGVLVAGAWGHSRARETVFGGATRSFLVHRDGPSLLLAH